MQTRPTAYVVQLGAAFSGAPVSSAIQRAAATAAAVPASSPAPASTALDRTAVQAIRLRSAPSAIRSAYSRVLCAAAQAVPP